MFCPKCGNQNVDGVKNCANCGAPLAATAANGEKCVVAFIVGLIGSIFALFGGLCVTACADVVGQGTAPMILMVGGSIVGLIGSCLCFSKAKIGSILMVVAAVMIAICAFGITGADMMSLVGMAMLGVAGIIGFVMTSSANK